MTRFLIMGIAAFVFFGAPVATLAVGGGGGGSVPPCTADVWSCGEWSECSPVGQQTRSCVMTVDCGTVETPKPAEQQACTPTCTADVWTCGAWSVCSGGKQIRNCQKTVDCAVADTPMPATEQNCASQPVSQPQQPTQPTSPACTVDTWRCDEWSACDADGNQQRICQKAFDCPSAQTPQPALFRRCETLQCGNKPTMYERIFCRLNLTPAGLARESELQYLPEECRALSNATQQKQCIDTYQSYRPCWSKPVGAERFACAKQALRLGPDATKAMAACNAQTGVERDECVRQLKEKVYSMVKFRIYDLEERAEELAEEGAPIDVVARFVTFIQEQKQAFNKAITTEERRQVILKTRVEWRRFVMAVKDKVK